MLRKKSPGFEWLEFELFEPFKQVVHGSFLKGSEEDKARVLGLEHLAKMKQEHKIGCHHVVTKPFQGGVGDILVTQEKGVGLAIQHADCQAAILFDPVTESIGALHAGWRGQVQGIYQEAIRQMKEIFGTKPEDLLVAISPSLGPKNSEFVHYRTELPQEFWNFRISETYFDLWSITAWQLETAGVLKENIQIARLCTYEDPSSFHSYRRDKTRDRQHTTIIGLSHA